MLIVILIFITISTGSYTVYGTEVVQGFTLWAETLNAQGGPKMI